jgi:hypothetical protein
LVRKDGGERPFGKLKLRTERKCQHYYLIKNLCGFGLDSAGSEQGSEVEEITQAEGPRKRSCEEHIWIQAGGIGIVRILMLSRYYSFNLISCDMLNMVMGNRTFTRCETKV